MILAHSNIFYFDLILVVIFVILFVIFFILPQQIYVVQNPNFPFGPGGAARINVIGPYDEIMLLAVENYTSKSVDDFDGVCTNDRYFCP